MSADTRSHVHALIDQLVPPQLTALETLLELRRIAETGRDADQ